MMIFQYFLIFLVILLLLVRPIKFLYKFNRRKHHLAKYVTHLKGVKGLPLIGSGLCFAGKNPTEIMEECLKFMRSYKAPFYAWFGVNLCIILDDPDDVDIVLNSKSCIDKAHVYKYFYRDALFTAREHIWRPQRKILNSAFNLKILQSFIPIFNAKSDLLVRNVGRMIGKGSFDVAPIIFACTLDMVSSTTLGSNINVQNGQNQEYLEAMQKFLGMTLKRMANVLYHFEFIYNLTNISKIERKFSKITEILPQKLIEAKRERFVKEGDDSHQEIEDENDENFYKTPQIFIDQLLRLHNKGIIDDKAIKDQVNLMLLAGTDTSAISTAHVILMLAMHPAVQDRVMEEINRVYSDVPVSAGSSSTYEHIRQLTYMEQVIKESLRLFPIAPFLMRHCRADTKTRHCIIPASATVIVSAHNIHRNPDIWGPNANEFDPEHFEASQMNARGKNTFLSFSRGPRDCIGMRYALISMKTMLVALLRRYKFSTHLKMEDIAMKFEIFTKLVSGDMVEVEERYPDLISK